MGEFESVTSAPRTVYATSVSTVPSSSQLDFATPENLGLTSSAANARPCTVTPGSVGFSRLHGLPSSPCARPHTPSVTPGYVSPSSSFAAAQSLTHVSSHLLVCPMSAASQPPLSGSHVGR